MVNKYDYTAKHVCIRVTDLGCFTYFELIRSSFYAVE